MLPLLYSCADKKKIVHPTVGDVTESVYASGKVKAVDQYVVYPTVNGILQHRMVHAGDTVREGQILFELENIVTALNSENARLALDLSHENSRKGGDKLQEIEMSVNQAKDKYQMDSIFYMRQKKLWEQNVGTQMELDQRKLTFTTSKDSYLSIKSKYAQTKLQLENELKRAKVNFTIAERYEGDYVIKSEVSGRVYDVLKEKGELVTPQTAIAIIGASNAFLLELEVDEYDIVKVHTGQQLLVTMDSHKGTVMDAIVTKIYPIMNEQARTFKIEARLVHPPKELYPNLSVEANIVIQTRKNVMTIPKEYLIDGKYVLQNNNKKKEVKTGLMDYKKVEITDGLTQEDLLHLPK